MKSDLLQLYPKLYHQVREIRTLTEIEDTLLDEWYDHIQLAWDNQFLDSAQRDGITARETIYKMKADSAETLEVRRERLRVRMLMKPPFTVRMLRQYLERFSDDFQITVLHHDYTVLLDIALESTRQRRLLQRALGEIIPANMRLRTAGRFRHTAETARLTPVCGGMAMVRHIHQYNREAEHGEL